MGTTIKCILLAAIASVLGLIALEIDYQGNRVVAAVSPPPATVAVANKPTPAATEQPPVPKPKSRPRRRRQHHA